MHQPATSAFTIRTARKGKPAALLALLGLLCRVSVRRVTCALQTKRTALRTANHYSSAPRSIQGKCRASSHRDEVQEFACSCAELHCRSFFNRLPRYLARSFVKKFERRALNFVLDPLR